MMQNNKILLEMNYTDKPAEWILHTGDIVWDLYCERDPETQLLMPVARLVNSQIQIGLSVERDRQIKDLEKYFESVEGACFLRYVWEAASDIDREISVRCEKLEYIVQQALIFEITWGGEINGRIKAETV